MQCRIWKDKHRTGHRPNIPAEAVAITIALNVILEFFGTAVNLFCLQAELVELAGALDRLDVNVLRKKF